MASVGPHTPPADPTDREKEMSEAKARRVSDVDEPTGPGFSPAPASTDCVLDARDEQKPPTGPTQRVKPARKLKRVISSGFAHSGSQVTFQLEGDAGSTSPMTRGRLDSDRSDLPTASSGSTSIASTTAGSTATVSTVKWQNLQNLKNLLNEGFITKTEYSERKGQLIDSMTGTTMSTMSTASTLSTRTRSTRGKSRSKLSGYGSTSTLPLIVPKGPPDFSDIEWEQASKLVYDLTARKWHASKMKVKLDVVPFSRGALRLTYHLHEEPVKKSRFKKVTRMEDQASSYVAKISMDPTDNENRQIYLRDVEMQTLSKFYAKQFNEYNPPKKVDFVKAWILQLDDREGSPICGVERFIDGPYRKHNNNFGFVSEEERNTPQAFSHFTYESSNHTLLVCDIQGVGDMYTDPQVHSVESVGFGFGKGNMAERGIERFIKTHRCNPICRYLKLPPLNKNPQIDLGTLPMARIMVREHVEVINIANFPRTKDRVLNPNSPLLYDSDDKEGTTCNFCCLL